MIQLELQGDLAKDSDMKWGANFIFKKLLTIKYMICLRFLIRVMVTNDIYDQMKML